MRIQFTKLPVNEDVIQVSFDEGATFIDYKVADIATSGITLSNTQDFSKVRIKSKSKILKNLDVIKTLKVASLGEVTFSETSSGSLKGDILNLEIPEGISTIKRYAFSSYTHLTNINIPNGTTVIEQCAFHNCTSLESIYLPKTILKLESSLFSKCDKLKTIVFEGTKAEWNNINKNPNWCPSTYNLKIIYLGESFSITQKMLNKGKIKDQINTYITSLIIANDVTYINDYAFEDCINIKSIIIPDSVISIGKGAFKGCSGLTDIELSNKISTIEDDSFNGCTNLERINIPDNIISIGNDAFKNCTALKILDIPKNAIKISDNAFNGCVELKEVYIDDSYNQDLIRNKVLSTTKIKSFYRLYAEQLYNTSELKYIIQSHPNCRLDETISKISNLDNMYFNNSCFKYLQSIYIPSSIKYLLDYCFAGCINLTDVIFAGDYIDLGIGTFDGCINLANITFPEKISSIYYNENLVTLSSLKEINYKGTKDQWVSLIRNTNWEEGFSSDVIINYNY
jgi:hypothetical protein